jgi:ATP-binding cassette subfamily B protein
MVNERKVETYHLLKDAWVWGNVAPYKKYLFQIIAIVFVTIAINFTVPLLTRSIVNEGILAGNADFINLIITLQGALYSALIVLNSVRKKISFHVSSRLVTRVTSEYFLHVVSLPMTYFRSSSPGEVVEHVRDLERVQRFAAVELVEATASAISIVSLSLLLLWINSTICVVFLLSAAAYLLWITGVGRRRRKVDAERFRENARSRAMEIGIVDAIQDMKIAGYEERSLAKWAELQLSVLETRLKAAAIEQFQASGGHLFTRIGMVLVTFFSARKAVMGEITLGDFTITSVIAVQLYFNVNQLLEFVNKLEDVRSALHRVHVVGGIAPERSDVTAETLSSQASPIVFREVSFRYPRAPKVSLEAISFDAKPGSMTALIGPSGSGKSTILKLVLRLYDPSSGVIEIGGHALAKADHAVWRTSIGAVMQEGTLFATSIRDNVVAGRDLDEIWLRRVIAAARLDEVLAAAPDGLDTVVGPGGAQLSAGQVQRILIGRALYKRPTLLLLDEATSALDYENEASIIANVRSLLPDVTSIVAAHRLNTVMDADQILLIDHGRIVDSGPPSRLLRMNAPGAIVLR